MADNESKLSLENARRVAGLLRPLSPQARNDLLIAKRDGDFQGFQKVAFENRLDANSIWTGIDDLWQQTAQGIDIPLENSGPNEPQKRGEGKAGIAGAIAGGVMLRKDGTYENFQKDAKEYAEFARKTWEKEEEKRLKDPNYKVKTGRAIDAQEAYDRAHREYHEMFTRGDRKKAEEWFKKNPTNISLALAINKVSVEDKKLTYEELKKIRETHAKTIESDWISRDPSKRSRDRAYMLAQAREEINDHLAFSSPETVKKWVAQYNDPELNAALERKKQRDEVQAIANQGRISKALDRNPAAKFAAQPGATPSQISPTRTSLPVLNPTFQPKLETEATDTDQSEDKQTTNATSPKKGVINKLNYYSPSQIRERVRTRIKNRIINSKIGQAFQKTRIGKLSSGLNRVSKKLKNLINPLNYLLNLFKRSLIGSVASAIGGFISSALTAVASGIIGIGGTVLTVSSLILAKVFTGLGVTLSSVSLPLVVIIAIVIFLIVTIFSIFFAPENEGDPIPESPYPGITYFILGPFEVPNGDSIDYDIAVIYDENKATAPLSGLKLVSDVPPGTRLVSLGTTGTYAHNPEANSIQWNLSDNPPVTRVEGVSTHEFSLRLDPDDDITVEVSISLLGAGAGGGGPPPAGGDCGGKYNSRNSEKGNFGDPACDHTKNAAADYMRSLDPQNADFWYLIAECESSHWPNAFNGNAVRASGAWGMYQMGVESSTDFPYVGGNMTWRQQAENAFNRETKVAETKQYNNPFDYWQCETNACQDAPGMCTDGEYNVRGRTW